MVKGLSQFPGILFVTLCFSLSSAAARAQTSWAEGKQVVEIRLLDESGEALSGERLPPLPLRVGQPFDEVSERASLRELFRTGCYADIRATVTEVPGGIRMDFLVRRNFFNSLVRIKGLKPPPSEGEALTALRLPLGDPFTESAVKTGEARLLDLLRENGYYEARADYTLTPHPDFRAMDVVYQITPGPRARIKEIHLVNRTRLENEDLLDLSGLSRGKQITAGRLKRAAERIRKKLVSDGYFASRAVIERRDYDPGTRTLPLEIEADAGPRVLVVVNGTHFSNSQIRKLVPIYSEGVVDDDLLQEGRRNIFDALQRDGYFDARVNYTSEENPSRGLRLITYDVNRGTRHRLVGVAFEGNKYFSTPLLESRLQLQLTTFTSRGRFSQKIVHDDAESVRSLYQSNGFRDVQVFADVLDDYQGKEGNLFVRFRVTQGPQTLVARLKLEGNKTISDDELLGVIGSTAGQPFSDANIASDRNNILAYYYNAGFPSAHCNAQVEEASQPQRVSVTYQVTEGTRVDVRQIYIAGYEHTREGIIAREVQVKAGGPLRESDVVESQRRLYNLGIFNRVTIAPQNPQGTDPQKTIEVVVDEAKRYTLGYGFGFEAQRLTGSSTNPASTSFSASPRGIFEITRANFVGRAQTVSLKLRASTFQYRGALTLTAPHFFALPNLGAQLTTYADKSSDVNTFTSTRYEAGAQLLQNISPTASVVYRYFFRHVLVGSPQVNREQIPLFSQPTKVSGFAVGWLRDHRDNPVEASHGNFNTVEGSLPLRDLGSSASFFRFYFQNSMFHSLGRSVVFARSTRFGVIEPINGTTADSIALPERFFAGGTTSIRGFSLNQAGPRDPVTGFPVGGLALLIFNQELRFPLKLPYLGNRLGGTFLYDAGNVYTDVSQITARYHPRSLTDLNYLSHTIGFGLRYPTPVGPVRIDFGYQLNPAQYQAQICTTQMPPICTTQILKLPHFQFFFNIGPVF